MVESNMNIQAELDLRKDKSCGRAKKSVFTWNTQDVLRWLQKYHPTYGTKYGHLFKENDIIGKVLVQLTVLQLEQMGIKDERHRVDIFEKIMKLRLKHEQVELKLLRNAPQTSQS